MEQLNLFDLEDENEALSVVTKRDSILNAKFNVYDQVKILLIDEEIDSETHHYRKYYEPHVIGKVGEISSIIRGTKGKISYEVDLYGTKIIFDEQELVWIG